MAAWDELKPVLVRLQGQQPCPLMGWPMPEVDEGRHPPFEIRLAAWATGTAEDLHQQFGDNVQLTVGALPYPPGRQLEGSFAADQPAELLDPREIVAELDGRAVVQSGQTLQHGLLLRNHTSEELQIATNGHVTATIVEPQTGETVGGFSGAQRLPLIRFQVAPAQTERIPLLIGTDSFTPRLGYVVPAGEWGLQATLALGPVPGSARRRTPILPLTITA